MEGGPITGGRSIRYTSRARCSANHMQMRSGFAGGFHVCFLTPGLPHADAAREKVLQLASHLRQKCAPALD